MVKQFDWSKCYWCGSKENIEIEHFIPKAAGGKNKNNIYPCCRKCNRGHFGKFDKNALSWAIGKFGFNIGYRKFIILKRKLHAK